MRARIAPVALTGGAAECAHLNRVDRSRRQPIENDVLRIAAEDARQPITRRRFDPAFVEAVVLHWSNDRDQMAGGPILNHETGRLMGLLGSPREALKRFSPRLESFMIFILTSQRDPAQSLRR